MNRIRKHVSLSVVLLGVASGCIFGGGSVPPSVGGSDDAASGDNNGITDAATPDNNGVPDAGNNGASDARNNGAVDLGGDAGDARDMSAVDAGPGELCGNGVVDPTETCDTAASGDDACPSFPADCNPDSCQQANISGTECSAVCEYVDRNCGPTDGCCPSNCSADVDEDCGAVCGNGMIEGAETCDSNCPTSCDDANVCTEDSVNGSAASCDVMCTNTPITSCVSGDGCCPGNCNSVTDNDCSASCGDNVVDQGETCDGDCPTGPSECDDLNDCTNDRYEGTPGNCNAACFNDPITTCKADGCCAPGCDANNDPDCGPICGNGVVEGTEICDGNCPTDCDDANACTTDTSTGTAATCDLVCVNVAKTCSAAVDGCCPMGCSAVTDADCSPVCGNNVIENGETCDGACPTSCDDNNACTTEALIGSPGSCNVECSYGSVTACIGGDDCCPAGCSANSDNDCSASCGNNVVEGSEKCDGDCPTAVDCAAISACHVLAGSAGQCTAECVQDPTCTPCDRNGTCPCAADEECNGGKCEPSDGDGCTNACDQPAFCSQFGQPGWICDEGDDFCYECTKDGHCESYQTCSQNACVNPVKCSGAQVPNDWCAKFEGPGLECVSGQCRQPCANTSECGATEACVSGYCAEANSCIDASRPEVWCSSKLQGDYCTTGGECVEACNQACDCKPAQTCATTNTTSGSQFACREATFCGTACGPNASCVQSTGDGDAACVVGAGPKSSVCSYYKRCFATGGCDLQIEACVSGVCEPAKDCAGAKEPNGWCAFYKGFGSRCDTAAFPPRCS